MKKTWCLMISFILLSTISALTVTADAPTVPEVDGPTEGYVGSSYEFTLTSTLEGDDAIQFFINWDDGNDSYWIPEEGVESEGELSVSHRWTEPGEYTIKVKARNIETEEETDWIEHTIHINSLKILSVTGGLGVTVTIQNMDDISKDVHWTVELIGGTFPVFHMNKFYEGDIEPLHPDTIATLATGTVFGLGNFKIKITLESAGNPVTLEIIEGKILFFYVLL